MSVPFEWVRQYWVDQMRKDNAPDLPDHISIEEFEHNSQKLANAVVVLCDDIEGY